MSLADALFGRLETRKNSARFVVPTQLSDRREALRWSAGQWGSPELISGLPPRNRVARVDQLNNVQREIVTDHKSQIQFDRRYKCDTRPHR